VQGNRLLMWQDIRLGYDPWGNLATKVRGSAQGQRTQQFIFDADNRLLAVRTESRNGSIETRFDYDALGRRIATREVQTEVGGQVSHHSERRFVWQGLRMVQELRETGLSNYLYSTDSPYTPLARVDAFIGDPAAVPSQQAATAKTGVFHFHTDLVGTPLEVTDEQGELAWAGDFSAWGKLKTDAVRAVQARIDQPLRYPGQYEDASTGLHYNTFRYYDPDIGRFISQDPIGLAGGKNLYAYAPNSTSWIDPLGLASYDPGVYDVLHESRLPESMYRLSDAAHFSEANRQLFYAMKNNPALRASLEARYPGIYEHVSPTRMGTFRGRAFGGTTWHHHGQVGGLLQLVDRADHGSRHLDYHSKGVGGRNTWGGGTGCR
jgi:RHS repeat-associated protein